MKRIGKFLDSSAQYYTALFFGTSVFYYLLSINNTVLYVSYVWIVMIYTIIAFFVRWGLDLELNHSKGKLLEVLSYVSKFFFYGSTVYSLMFIAREFELDSNVLIIIDISIFVFVAYGSIILNIIFGAKIRRFQYRIILYLSILSFMIFYIFDYNNFASSDSINSLWVVILLDNLVYIILEKRIGEITL